MNLKRVVGSVTIFLFIIAMGTFCAWIGGVVLFTSNAGFIAALTLFAAGWLSVMFYSLSSVGKK